MLNNIMNIYTAGNDKTLNKLIQQAVVYENGGGVGRASQLSSQQAPATVHKRPFQSVESRVAS
jgi:UDP-N-acetyl-D-mannosaminuronic acid transferase (WecB/TagA/CpsF family)